MSMHSVAEAKSKLSELIDRALDGEGVVITRHGRPVVELRPLAAQSARQIARDDLDWLAARRVGAVAPRTDAGTLVGTIRDDDEH